MWNYLCIPSSSYLFLLSPSTSLWDFSNSLSTNIFLIAKYLIIFPLSYSACPVYANISPYFRIIDNLTIKRKALLIWFLDIKLYLIRFWTLQFPGARIAISPWISCHFKNWYWSILFDPLYLQWQLNLNFLAIKDNKYNSAFFWSVISRWIEPLNPCKSMKRLSAKFSWLFYQTHATHRNLILDLNLSWPSTHLYHLH
jgi:hypothetical protein